MVNFWIMLKNLEILMFHQNILIPWAKISELGLDLKSNRELAGKFLELFSTTSHSNQILREKLDVGFQCLDCVSIGVNRHEDIL